MLGFIIGTFLGANLGLLVGSLCFAASEADDQGERK